MINTGLSHGDIHSRIMVFHVGTAVTLFFLEQLYVLVKGYK